MALSDDDLAWVRTYAPWTPPTDGDLNARFDALTVERQTAPGYVVPDYPRSDVLIARAAVAEWFVRARLSQMIDDPSSFSVDGGEYSESWSANITALRERLKELVAIAAGGTADGGGMTVAHVTRVGGSDFRNPCVDDHRNPRYSGLRW